MKEENSISRTRSNGGGGRGFWFNPDESNGMAHHGGFGLFLQPHSEDLQMEKASYFLEYPHVGTDLPINLNRKGLFIIFTTHANGKRK